MKSNKIVKSILLGLAVIIFMACGGNNNTVEGFNGDAYEKIAIDVPCATPDTIEQYKVLKSGDQIVEDITSTQVSLFHDINNVKRVCLKSGKAHINRQNIE